MTTKIINGRVVQEVAIVSEGDFPLATGASTAANQATIIGHVDGIESLLSGIDIDTGSIDSKLPALVGGKIPVDIAGATLSVGDISISGVTVDNTSGNPVPVSDAGGSITVDGPLTDAQLRATAVTIDDGGGSITVDGPLTDSQLRAVAVPVSAASLPLPSGAATAANQSTIIDHVDGLESGLGAQADAAASSDTGTFSLIAFVKRALQNWTTLLSRIPTLTVSSTRLLVDGSGVTQPVSGTVATTVAVRTPTTTSVTSSATSVTILASNANRRGVSVSNISTSKLYLSFTSPATTTNCFIEMPAGSFLLLDQQMIVTSAIYGIWSSANGTAQVTEYV